MNARRLWAWLAVVMLASASALVAEEQAEGEKEFKATCPVSGKPAKEPSVVKIGKDLKVYFCCDNCPKAFKANPEKFDLKVRRQLLETGQMVQVACPVSGQPVDKETLIEVGEAKAGFCCEKCQAKYNEADEDGKLAILFKDLKKAFTRQTKCPVSGKPINPEAMVEHKGQKVYFCCPNCPKAFSADPAKFMAKLPQFADEDQGLPPSDKDKG